MAEEAQEDERIALQAIFEDLLVWDRTDSGVYGTLSVPPSLDSPISLSMPNVDGETDPNRLFELAHLPPILIRFRLTSKYPSSSPPSFAVDAPYLSRLQRQKLHRYLLNAWEEIHDVCLFEWADFCQTRALDYLNLLSPPNSNSTNRLLLIGHDETVKPETRLDLCNLLLAYDRNKAAAEFEALDFDCGICFSPHRGSESMRFNPCKHVFCRPCLYSYFELLIREGDVDQVGCPDAKCKREAALQRNRQGTSEGRSLDVLTTIPVPQADMLSIVGKELFERYLEFLKKKLLDGRSDVAYCPRPDCQAPTIITNKDDKLVVCTACGFAYCHVCSSVWHGYASYCKSNFKLEELVNQYNQASEADKRRLEFKYGKKTLERAVKEWDEEHESLLYLKENTQRCPTCNAAVERSEGCCHMTCKFCNSHFCYLCGQFLLATNPYGHFNDRKSKCFGKLFEGEGADALEEWEVEEGEGRW
ncbi:hypothetical protein SmJEL517_g00028 [Synchytrium microbalum]|uniref:RBR-type E3 ubiquitin transferase n=1 Tax=Synchytrium microbalum TaxID=1806994 RepID=A0A507CJM2_9FUNG|nr:uncharacterized protein SmJEL517_g00028 [Synchytrium microbalum]TPX38025.1 hypothetical protein SmJEL517_g00028 [Synchytrium microbalum]